MARNKKLRVAIVDDHPVARMGLRHAIEREPGWTVSGEAENSQSALDIISRSGPDIVIVDLTLQDESGLDLIRTLHARHPGLPVLVVSMHDEELYAERVIRLGARGYVRKDRAMEVVIEAIRTVMKGEIYLSDPLKSKLLNQTLRGRPAPSAISGLEKLKPAIHPSTGPVRLPLVRENLDPLGGPSRQRLGQNLHAGENPAGSGGVPAVAFLNETGKKRFGQPQMNQMPVDVRDFPGHEFLHVSASAPVVGLHRQEPLDLLESKSQTLRILDEEKPRQRIFRIHPVSGQEPVWLGERSYPLIVPHRLGTHAGPPGQLAPAHRSFVRSHTDLCARFPPSFSNPPQTTGGPWSNVKKISKIAVILVYGGKKIKMGIV